MAFLRRITAFGNSNLGPALLNEFQQPTLKSVRCLTVTPNLQESEGWLSKLLMVRKIDTGKESHSRLLSDTEKVFELYVHIWSYDGWKHASSVLGLQRNDSSLNALVKDQEPFLRSRQNQFMLSFSFWPNPEPQVHNSFYEMRSYILKPGTMIEWGNNWARGINYRRNNAVAGFFSQIGQLYMVHHIWRYEDLVSRKETRESAWRQPGWDECVGYTVPLIREMRSRWMSPNSFSPIK
ncbi:PREDICTED: protein NipSnap-like [Rhagoletis zephyria]|uniref:protein NipSnap-like n=1 Tax=Rhagoletis zephyria TaxID=28612 RepID=UPI000811A657|nr:PREDICTED: protein NipSnap-like [Rhagoletis zephyria]